MSSSDQFYHGTITRRVDFAPDLWSIRVNPGGKFNFRPGQYATLGVQSTDKRSERAYSIVSSPHENEIEFFIELVPGGELTPQLYSLQPGSDLRHHSRRGVIHSRRQRVTHRNQRGNLVIRRSSR